MISTLPKSLIETASKLNEAVALKTHIQRANKASISSKFGGVTTAERISKHVIPLGTDSITIPLERDDVVAHPQVEDHLNEHGYEIHDYKKGLAIKKGETKNPISIGKVLARTNAPQSLKTIYEKDPNRQGIVSGAKIVISRNPLHVAGMSTHQNWESCQTLGGGGTHCNDAGEIEDLPKQKIGELRNYVDEDIKAGSHIAYLVHDEADVDKHYKPISRILLKPYTSPSGHTVLRPAPSYGDEWGGFESSVRKWSEHHFPMKDHTYTLNKSVYQEGKPYVYNYAQEHDEHWKNDTSPHVRLFHPSESVLDHHLSKLDARMPGLSLESTYKTHTRFLISDFSRNPHLKDKHVGILLNHPASTMEMNKHIVAMSQHPSAINYGLAHQELHAHVAHNPKLTSKNIDHLLHVNKTEIEEPEYTSSKNTGQLIASLNEHPNLTREHADYMLQKTNAIDYPTSVGHAITKASPDVAKTAIDNIESQRSFLAYYKESLGIIAHKKPEYMKHLSNIGLVYAYDSKIGYRNQATRGKIEEEMLSRGDSLHRIVASRSNNIDTVNHVMSISNDPEVKIVGGNNIRRLTSTS